MKQKIVVSIVACLLAISVMPSISADQLTDTFDITVRGEFLWIDITNASWIIGMIELGSIHYTNETGVTFIADIDNCTVNIDLSIQITTDGATWNDGAIPASDVYRLNASNDTWVAHDVLISEASDTVISSDYVFGTNETFDLRFDAPTTGTSGAQQTIVVTASIVKH